ncbi:VOC family protein [Spirosoma utsteinense]|uniref:Enzyme related to lactoylglutathione lyase n=1 Tax=Spirosoma utsteinense TaxID=2585773 RepID=A0ABR6WEC0_9BACT|nr:VOC family protein [Spirosoma utsteinense]MBC3788679.1 putative enzyme related to lactoylglutathione lyase [Spirosoma utsteinense]MBC3794629.1 putative enzyme related to lactoylglutathione lyase [Spirosoma utsteinense]
MSAPTQLGFVSLQVSDLDVSRQFYTDVLDFQPADQSPPDACVFATQDGAIFTIRKPLVDLNATSHLGWGVSLWFAITDLNTFLQRVEGKATLVRGVQPSPFGNTAIIADPDGYWLTLQETKAA